jgi:hypothetical protein
LHRGDYLQGDLTLFVEQLERTMKTKTHGAFSIEIATINQLDLHAALDRDAAQ